MLGLLKWKFQKFLETNFSSVNLIHKKLSQITFQFSKFCGGNFFYKGD